MSLPNQVKEAIYSAIVASANDSVALQMAMDALYTDICLHAFQAAVDVPEVNEMDNEELKKFVDPLFMQLSEDINLTLVPYGVSVNPWTAKTLSKRIAALQGEE